ncbi:Polyketide cyclase / dehydrase and lipid transport [Falsiruegeria litorea R37]|uniref:Polyketide cyclase / dehydrase and lipid transport n=1 Tax=Falsiruegeria litorea R37 TaxID=1200284 RepID=A0A1Y5TFG8_9RHOB|nr:SRPBCC family protein [Falsiruegeria litorea]SLN62595.1 Polyketide cyclase / dehydrase and lipid transport [Falsiruegeria litorea R37]
MKLIKRLFLTLVVVVVALVAVSFLLPGQAAVSRSITINAPANAVFPHVNSMQATEAWSPWLSRDPETKLSYSGPDTGVGNTLSWMSEHPQVGSGTQEIVESIENQLVRTELDFGPMGTATATFDLQPEGTGTKVTWGFQSDLGLNPISRWMGLMMDDWVGSDYETGLANLKVVVESGQ